MHIYKYVPQTELSQNSMFKNIVNFKPSFGLCLSILHTFGLLPLVTNTEQWQSYKHKTYV